MRIDRHYPPKKKSIKHLKNDAWGFFQPAKLVFQPAKLVFQPAKLVFQPAKLVFGDLGGLNAFKKSLSSKTATLHAESCRCQQNPLDDFEAETSKKTLLKNTNL